METLQLFKRGAAVIGACLGLVSVASAQTDTGFPAPTGSVASSGAKVEKLFEGDCFAEGPSVGPDNMVSLNRPSVAADRMSAEVAAGAWDGVYR